ncbi:DUF2778 domain-containing protein [Methylobacterium sp. E-065]|uniref:tlde1 domain-containing protein n=1 Tax=Methylobacterium sp. E-065 TaxID=2836583 RepID=UPI001FB9486C|nr:tlde1 domain-containing protein [Methylobacterium sp. E-065]MCJ2017534.1 DUF2778 domain-containing protein [Methylobacterium sp. E-065]
MAQAAMSRTAYQVAEPVRRAAPQRIVYVETPYDPVARTRVPYPSAMRRARRRARLTGLIGLTAVTLAGWAILIQPQGPAPSEGPALRPALATAPHAASQPNLAWMLDPSPALGSGAATDFGGAALPTDFQVAATTQVALSEPSPAVREIARQVARAEQVKAERIRTAQAPDAPVAASKGLAAPKGIAGTQAPAPLRLAMAEPTPAAFVPNPASALVPLPVARPAELRPQPAAPRAALPARVAARALPRTRDVFRAAMAEEPSFFEKLFGVGAAAPRQEPRQALAYASPDTLPQAAPRTRISPEPESVGGTAVYDITARTVTLPSGEVLEAHSGLGEAMDSPRFVHLRMRGSTPPGTYMLTERERLFHGVRAIRLTPVGGSGSIHGRDGLLAHTYMLRQPGASNGCVSFRDYNRFLQAFLRGEVRRLVVVAGDGLFGRVGMGERGGSRG